MQKNTLKNSMMGLSFTVKTVPSTDSFLSLVLKGSLFYNINGFPHVSYRKCSHQMLQDLFFFFLKSVVYLSKE